MEGSIFSILPLLFLIILGLPAMVPNFTGKLRFAGGKSVWIWGLLARQFRKGVTLLDFLFSTPVVQLPVLMVCGSGTANYLAIWGIKILSKYWGNNLIYQGVHYLSLYIYILIIQISIIYIKNFMGNIRGSQSGNTPQRARWVFSPLDFMFMWALNGVLLISPIMEWAIKFFMGAFPTNPGWENYVVENLCWLFIFISVRLTVFLPEQRPKCKLLTMAFFLLCLSINIEPGSMAKTGNIACTMNVTNKLI